jgi:hypothetical protein
MKKLDKKAAKEKLAKFVRETAISEGRLLTFTYEGHTEYKEKKSRKISASASMFNKKGKIVSFGVEEELKSQKGSNSLSKSVWTVAGGLPTLNKRKR